MTNTYYFGLKDGIRINRTNSSNETTEVKFHGDIVIPTYIFMFGIAVIGTMTYLERRL